MSESGIEIAAERRAGSSGGSVSHPVWGRGFRPFFLGACLYAGVVVLAWTAIWQGFLSAPPWLTPTAWHAHEMLFGVVAAAIAGFLLTAAPVWVGRPAPAGRLLQVLAALWAVGRVAMLAAGALPIGLVAALDLAFLPALAFVLARIVWGTGQLRNQGVVALVAALALANGVVHAQALGVVPLHASAVLRLAVDVVVTLVVVIGGRITPAFTANSLRRRGLDLPLRSRPWLDRLAVAAVLATALVGFGAGRGTPSGVVALAAGLAVAGRMLGWQTRQTGRDPLVWSLHAGLGWVVIGLLAVGASDLGAALPASVGLHALTAGAMGGMILAVITRVALGHTGRALTLPAGAVGCYALVHLGAAARVAAPLLPALPQRALLAVGGVLWSGAFLLCAFIYAPILTRPRVDGKPG